jgi:hypothetical protein
MTGLPPGIDKNLIAATENRVVYGNFRSIEAATLGAKAPREL